MTQGKPSLIRKLYIGTLMLICTGCAGVPEGIKPVSDFKMQAYLGVWHEIARYDHAFERGLDDVTAEYLSNPDKAEQLMVINKGFDRLEDKWSIARGRAKFKSRPDEGHLLVSFFGPFYSSYVILELVWNKDKSRYQQAFVTGPNRKYFWWLHRSKNPSADDFLKAQAIAVQNGFDWEEILVINKVQD